MSNQPDRILTSRADRLIRTLYWPVSVRELLPVLPIPLRGKDPAVPLNGEDVTWAKELWRGRGRK